MRSKGFWIVGILVGIGLVGGAQSLEAWVQAHWEDLASGDPARVAARFAPDAGVAFVGGPWDGFYYGTEAIEDLWATLFAAMGVEALHPLTEPKAIPEANLAYAQVELRTAGGPVVLWHYHRFDEAGRILASDYVGVAGLAPLGPVIDGALAEGEYRNFVRDPRSGVVFRWRNGLVVLFGALESPGSGWVSVGFDPVNRMQGANFIIAAVTPGGLVIEDHFGTSPTAHRRDRREDILDAAGARVDGGTLVEFVIPLDSGDPEDKPLVPGRTYTVLLAYHRSSPSFTVQHTARGSVRITLEN